MKSLADWYVNLSLGSAALFAFAFFLGCCILILVIDAWRDPLKVELRAIRRKRRRERKILARSRALITAHELARHREDCSVQTSRAFMRAFRETHGL